MPQNATTGEFTPCTWTTCTVEHDGSIRYRPSLPGNVVYLACFGILLVFHATVGVRWRTHAFLILVCVGAFGEMVGYLGRLWVRQDPWTQDPFLVYLVPITLAPAFITAAIYLCLGRIIRIHGSHHARLSPRAITRVFVFCDVVSLVVQSLGGAIASVATDPKTGDLGIHVMMGGLVFQVLSMTAFLILWGDFMWTVRRDGGRDSGKVEWMAIRRSRSFLRFQIALIVATVFVFARSIFRCTELAGGFSGSEANNEVLFMILEGPMIIGAILLMAIYHPGRVFGDVWREAARNDDDEFVELEARRLGARK
ncbi:hypothetical protein HKX48_001195 [Thoreauomyces humboldtii]|nr:hypothetical protein HKX48_001195 [Thoreauomyces humboldtii]